MYYIYIDESGNLIKNDKNTYIVICSFSTYDYIFTQKKIIAWFKNKLNKKGIQEIKWSDRYISDAFRLKTLKYMLSLCIHIQYSYQKNLNIPIKYFSKYGLETGKLYTDLVIKTIEKYDIKDKTNIYVFCDKVSLKNIKTGYFIKFVEDYFSLKYNKKIHVQMIHSYENPNIQIADWIAGAVHRFLRKGRLWMEIGQILNLYDSEHDE